MMQCHAVSLKRFHQSRYKMTSHEKSNTVSFTQVYIIVRSTEILVINRATENAIQTTPITEVTYSDVDPNDSHRFIYITVSKGLKSCHLFTVKFNAIELPAAVGKAFEATAAEIKRMKEAAQSGSPVEEQDSVMAELVRAALEQRKSSKSGAQEIGKPLDAFYVGSNPASKAFGEQIVRDSWAQLLAEVSPFRFRLTWTRPRNQRIKTEDQLKMRAPLLSPTNLFKFSIDSPEKSCSLSSSRTCPSLWWSRATSLWATLWPT